MATRSKIAKIFEVDPSTVSRWRMAGCPVSPGGNYDERSVRDWLRGQKTRKAKVQQAWNTELERIYEKYNLWSDERIIADLETSLESAWDAGDDAAAINLIVELLRTLSCALEVLSEDETSYKTRKFMFRPEKEDHQNGATQDEQAGAVQ
jgi:phage terminase Nu1 subunit (DNA packaging protein)